MMGDRAALVDLLEAAGNVFYSAKTNGEWEVCRDKLIDNFLASRRPDAPSAGEGDCFRRLVAAVELEDSDLDYAAVKIRYGRGTLDRETRKVANDAIRTLRAILREARALPAPPQADGGE